ncbi:hypothetical protein SCUP515_11379 [Seiridium cupressi]
MGSKASKTAQSATRKFPARAPGAVPPSARPAAPRAPSQTPGGSSEASLTKNQEILADGTDPDSMTNHAFSQRLKQMGVATPNPTLSNSSTATPGPPAPRSSPLGPSYPSASHNQTLNALEARQRLEEQIELQFENPAAGREFADVGTLRQALMMRKRGLAAADVEKRLRLKAGVVAKIESGGVIAPLTI